MIVEGSFGMFFAIMAFFHASFWNACFAALPLGMFSFYLTHRLYINKIEDEELRKKRSNIAKGIFLSLHPVIYILIIVGYLSNQASMQREWISFVGIAYCGFELICMVFPLKKNSKEVWGDFIVNFHSLALAILFSLTPILPSEASFPFFLSAWISIVAINLILDNLLFLWGDAIGIIKKIVSYCIKKEIGAPLSASFSTMMALTSLIAFFRGEGQYHMSLFAFYLAFALIRFGCFFWKKVIDNRYRDSEERRIGRSSKIALVGCVLLMAIDANYTTALVIIMYRAIEGFDGLNWFFYVQLAHAIFRIIMAIRGISSKRTKQIPYYRLMITIDIILMMYSVASTVCIGLSAIENDIKNIFVILLLFLVLSITIYLLIRLLISSIRGVARYNSWERKNKHEQDIQ